MKLLPLVVMLAFAWEVRAVDTGLCDGPTRAAAPSIHELALESRLDAALAKSIPVTNSSPLRARDAMKAILTHGTLDPDRPGMEFRGDVEQDAAQLGRLLAQVTQASRYPQPRGDAPFSPLDFLVVADLLARNKASPELAPYAKAIAAAERLANELDTNRSMRDYVWNRGRP